MGLAKAWRHLWRGAQRLGLRELPRKWDPRGRRPWRSQVVPGSLKGFQSRAAHQRGRGRSEASPTPGQ